MRSTREVSWHLCRTNMKVERVESAVYGGVWVRERVRFHSKYTYGKNWGEMSKSRAWQTDGDRRNERLSMLLFYYFITFSPVPGPVSRLPATGINCTCESTSLTLRYSELHPQTDEIFLSAFLVLSRFMLALCVVAVDSCFLLSNTTGLGTFPVFNGIWKLNRNISDRPSKLIKLGFGDFIAILLRQFSRRSGQHPLRINRLLVSTTFI